MRIAVLGGGGAMGGLFGGYLTRAGEDVVLVDVSGVSRRDRTRWPCGRGEGRLDRSDPRQSLVEAEGCQPGVISSSISSNATTPEAAIASASPMLGRDTAILTKRNWGNADRIAAVAKPDARDGIRSPLCSGLSPLAHPTAIPDLRCAWADDGLIPAVGAGQVLAKWALSGRRACIRIDDKVWKETAERLLCRRGGSASFSAQAGQQGQSR